MALLPTISDCEVWKIKRLEDSLSRHDRFDEFGLVFEVGVRVAVAQLFGRERFELRLVLCEYRLAQRFDCLFDLTGSSSSIAAIAGTIRVVALSASTPAAAKSRRVKFMAILPL